MERPELKTFLKMEVADWSDQLFALIGRSRRTDSPEPSILANSANNES